MGLVSANQILTDGQTFQCQKFSLQGVPNSKYIIFSNSSALILVGIVFEKRRDYGAAMKAYSDCLRIRSSKFGSDSMEVAQGRIRGTDGSFCKLQAY